MNLDETKQMIWSEEQYEEDKELDNYIFSYF